MPEPKISKSSMKGDNTLIDKQWFNIKLKEKNKSQSGLARHLNVDRSAITRMLSNERKIKLDEATKIAEFLETSVEEVLHHAGVSISIDSPKPLSINDAKQSLAASLGVDVSAITITISA